MSDEINISRLRKYDVSMDVPGRGNVEIPKGMDDMGGLGNGRNTRNARHFANVMGVFGGNADSVDYQYQKEAGKTGRGKGV